MSARRFRKRFIALSVGAHLSPLLVLVALEQMLDTPPEPPPPPKPMAVTLLYVDSKEAGSAGNAPSEESRASENTSANTSKQRRVHPANTEKKKKADKSQRTSPTPLSEAFTTSQFAYAGFQAPVGRHQEKERVRDVEERRLESEVEREAEAEPEALAGPPKRSLRERLRSAGMPQQDRERAMAENRRRIDEAMPLTLWDDEREKEVIGTVRVRFTLGRDGYVEGFRILEASETAAVNHAAHEVLHLAEPLLYVPGPIEMELEFRG